MRRLVIAEIKPDDLKAAASEVKRELQCLAYGDNVSVKNGTYYIIGKENIKRFVASLNEVIAECRELFKDPESIAEFEADEAFLKSLLKLKAS